MIDPILFDFLKKLAFISNFGMIEINTKELAERMDVSQQSVSRYLIMLEEQGFIIRKRTRKGEEIILTEKSFAEIERERNELTMILNKGNQVEVTGTVFSGMGEGSYYMSRKKYKEGILKYLGFEPYPGTLNVKIDDRFSNLSEMLPTIKGFYVDPFEEEGRKFGGIKLLKAEIENFKCGIVIPDRTHYNGVLEIISYVKLRDQFGIKDDDKIKIKIIRD